MDRIKHLKEVFSLELKHLNRALKIRTKEIERRLNALNGEAERLRIMQSTYLPRETYEANYKEIISKIDLLQKMIFIGLGLAIALQIAIPLMLRK